jgi:hypothetical protein
MPNKWYGWIPTNLGVINFDFIDERNIKNISDQYGFSKTKTKIVIKNLDVSLISDSSIFYKKIILPLQSKKEYSPEVNVEIKKTTDLFEGTIKFYYKEDTSISWSAVFKIELNGKIEFEFTKIYENIESIKQILFIILKMIIHGDNHHHQKIDTALRITNNKFDEKELLDNMLLHIKTIEKNVKSLDRECSTRLRQNITINEVEGYISYINTFVTLFDANKKLGLENRLQRAINIKSSLSSLIDKREKKFNATNSFKTLILTILGLFIATNILVNSFYDTHIIKNMNEWSLNIVRCIILCFYIVIFILFAICDFKSYFYYQHYKMFSFFNVIKYYLSIFLGLIFILISIYIYIKLP